MVVVMLMVKPLPTSWRPCIAASFLAVTSYVSATQMQDFALGGLKESGVHDLAPQTNVHALVTRLSQELSHQVLDASIAQCHARTTYPVGA